MRMVRGLLGQSPHSGLPFQADSPARAVGSQGGRHSAWSPTAPRAGLREGHGLHVGPGGADIWQQTKASVSAERDPGESCGLLGTAGVVIQMSAPWCAQLLRSPAESTLSETPRARHPCKDGKC